MEHHHFPAFRMHTLALLTGIATALTACNAPAVSSAASAGSVSVAKAESYALCPDGSFESGLNLIDDAKSWQAFTKSSIQKAPGLADWKPNFSSSRIVVFRLGSKSSAGFGIKAMDIRASPGVENIVLNVQTSKPAPGSFNASVVTSPCLIAQISTANFKSLTVYDLTESKALGQISQ